MQLCEVWGSHTDDCDVMVCTAPSFKVDSEHGGLEFFSSVIHFLPNYTAQHPQHRALDYVICLCWGTSTSRARKPWFRSQQMLVSPVRLTVVKPTPSPMGYEDSFLRGKADHSPPPSANVKTASLTSIHGIEVNQAQRSLHISQITS
jgi:hypothetical protein